MDFTRHYGFDKAIMGRPLWAVLHKSYSMGLHGLKGQYNKHSQLITDYYTILVLCASPILLDHYKIRSCLSPILLDSYTICFCVFHLYYKTIIPFILSVFPILLDYYLHHSLLCFLYITRLLHHSLLSI